MTTKELIRAELKRLEEMDYPVDTYEQSVGFYNALDRIKSFLDTLEEPVSEDLEEAARQYERSRPFAPDESEPESTRKAFIAGAEWDAEHFRDTTKKVSKDLEEAAENIYKVPFGTRAEDFKAGAEWQRRKEQDIIETAEDHAFLAGANWQKEQNKMMACKWFRNGGKCGKGLPGTPCELEGCVAWEHSEEEKK